ncbi:glycosyltransferase family 4 protein [Brachybacterium aquaticum]|uniref:D-inositol 3-phosphate glycosyltransferase n=1 Tax=Brachybacterium aquaticum TaxID=1432564 RepID=A0A841ABW6_9MICO|nr:glycosyltransferase family 4 protein [Brachybacterium aquaticum]MBB5832719.1 glycosyltransferase involved in cell wall biosynthesis [Brachybacterium aquaticum]
MTDRQPLPVDAPLRVVIIANFTSDTAERNDRFNDLACRFAERGADVELVTSQFSHSTKTMRRAVPGGTGYTITHVREPGYAKNVSFARLRSQAAFADAVGKHLVTIDPVPDLVLAATPPPAVADVAGAYAKRIGAAFVVDVQDIWPEAFSMVSVLPAPVIDLLFSSMNRHSADGYRRADRVVGVSHTFIEAAVAHGADPARTSVVYLGTDLGNFDRCAAGSDPLAAQAVAAADERSAFPTVGYAGGLSASYDLRLVIDALALLARERPTGPTPSLVVMGDGALRAEFEAYAQGKGLDVTFTGNLPYPDMVRTLAKCRIAVNPIVADSAGSVLNKAGDYAAAGLPVVNSQESAEYRELLERYGAGISCATGDAQDMAAAFRTLIDDPSLRRRKGLGSRRMAEELFDRSVTYERMVDELSALARSRVPRGSTSRLTAPRGRRNTPALQTLPEQ